MADLLEHDPNIIERESALSDEIKKSFEEQGGILDATADILKNILGVLKGDDAKSDADDEKRASPIVDGLARLGVGIEETLDDAVGLIVDPIRKGLKDVAEDITGGLDYAMGAGMVVATLEWLWDNWDVAMQKMGAVWDWMKEDDRILNAVGDIGIKIWDNLPGWMRSTLEAVGGVISEILEWLSAGTGWILKGVEAALKAVGLDEAAKFMGTMAESLLDLSDWLDTSDRFAREQAAEEKKWREATDEEKQKMRDESARRTDAEIGASAGVLTSGNREAIDLFKYAKEQGLGAIRASHLAQSYIDDPDRGAAVSERFREATGVRGRTRKDVLQAFGESSRMTSGKAEAWLQDREVQETTAPAIPVTPDVMDGLQGVVEEKAAKAKREEDNNQLLKQLLDETRKSNEEKTDDSAAVAVPMIDPGSADALSAFGHGNMAGGIGT